ncbi:MAG: hypothetical protein LBV40_07520 [Methanomicrobiales archaeon]|jgi:hypothetical protein|nr:hypothetical protein [Methanomicrobiales archaeon]
MTKKKYNSVRRDAKAKSMTSPTEPAQNIELTEAIQPSEETSPIELTELTELDISSKEKKAAQEAEKKKDEYFLILKRTFIAIGAGVLAGLICFYFEKGFIGTQGSSDFAFLSILIMIASIFMQKHIFMLLRIDYTTLQKKDWVYQGFMTFGFWLITWTMFLSGTFQESALETAINATASIMTVP